MPKASQQTAESLAEAERIRPYWLAARRDLGLTQIKLAASLGVVQSSVNRWLTGEQPIPTERLMELAALLNFDPVEIRPDCARFLRPTGKMTLSESAQAVGGMFDNLDDAGRAAVETVVRTLFDASKSQRKP